jgi:hypothetical protein
MSRPGRKSADDSFQVDARAKGHGDVRVVVQGTQHNVENHYYGEARDAAGPIRPFDLPNLRLWIDRIVNDYRRQVTGEVQGLTAKEAADQLRQLTALQHSVDDPPANAGGRNTLRRLLASGVAQYLSRADQLTAGQVPEQLLVDLLVFAIWAVLEAPRLPETWLQDLAELTSPRVAVLTEAARNAKAAGQPAEVEAFASVLSAKPVSQAVINLLDDLNDPGRGGSAFTALAVAAGLPSPPRRGGAKATATWVFAVLTGATAGATAGVIEEEVSRLLGAAPSGAPHPFGDHGSHQPAAPGHHHPHIHHHSLLEDILSLFLPAEGSVWETRPKMPRRGSARSRVLTASSYWDVRRVRHHPLHRIPGEPENLLVRGCVSVHSGPCPARKHIYLRRQTGARHNIRSACR